jgi:hypothetical protein
MTCLTVTYHDQQYMYMFTGKSNCRINNGRSNMFREFWSKYYSKNLINLNKNNIKLNFDWLSWAITITNMLYYIFLI